MPRVGATDDQKREEERAVLAHLIKRMVAAKVPPSIPLLPGRDRSVEVPPILLEGGALAGLAAELLGVSSDVREGQPVGSKTRAPLSEDSFLNWWRREFEECCKPGDAAAFRELAAKKYGLDVPEVRALRGQECGRSTPAVRPRSENDVQSPSRRIRPRGHASPLASLPSMLTEAAAAVRTRGFLAHDALCTNVAMHLEQMSDLTQLGSRLSAEQLAQLLQGFADAGGSVAEVAKHLPTDARAQLVSALLQDEQTRRALQGSGAGARAEAPSEALAVATAAVLALDREERLQVLDALGEELMSKEVRAAPLLRHCPTSLLSRRCQRRACRQRALHLDRRRGSRTATPSASASASPR